MLDRELTYSMPYERLAKLSRSSQMLLEDDGVAISRGSLFFMVSNTAFADERERKALVLDVFSRLNGVARGRSAELLSPVLDADAAR